MKKFFAWLILSVVILQAFFIPVLADEEEPQYEAVSLWETDIYQDFGVSSLSELKTLVGGSFGAGNPSFFEILNVAVEEFGTYYNVFLYFINRACDVDIQYFGWDLSGSGVPSSYARYGWTVPDHSFYKLVFRISKLDTDLYQLENDQLSFTIHSIGPCPDQDTYLGQPARYEEYVGGSCSSYLTVSFDMASVSRGATDSVHFAQTFSSENKLKLDVTMMSERFTSPVAYSFYQLNTAAFIVPNSYFEDFGYLRSVQYNYDLYADVPMLVIKKNVASYFLGSSFNSSDSDYDFDPLPYKHQHHSQKPVTVARSIPLTHPGLDDFHDYGPERSTFYDYARYFVFPVDSIENYGGYDFSSVEALKRYDFYKDINCTGLMGYSSKDHFEVDLTPDHVWSTLSFQDVSNWFERLISYGVWPWESLEDDSLDEVSAFDIVDSDPSSLTDSEFRTSLYLDPKYKETLHDLYEQAVSSDGTLVLMRFSLTDYSIESINSLFLNGDFQCWTSGYICKNAIISDFDIIRIWFRPIADSPDGPSLYRTYKLISANPGGGTPSNPGGGPDMPDDPGSGSGGSGSGTTDPGSGMGGSGSGSSASFSDLPDHSGDTLVLPDGEVVIPGGQSYGPGGDVVDHSGDIPVEVEMDPIPGFIEGGQSHQSIVDPLVSGRTKFSRIKSSSKWKIVLIVFVSIVALWGLSKVLKLIKLAREAFGRRFPYDHWGVDKHK